jgi:small subunit ribosomal protein S1
MYGEQKSMEFNKPVVGGEESEQDVSSTVAPPAGATNGAAAALQPETPNESPADQSTSDTGRAPDVPAEIEHDPQVEQRGEAEATIQDDPQAGAEAQVAPESQPEGQQVAIQPESQVQSRPEGQPQDEPESAPESQMQSLLDQQPDESQVKKGDILEGTIAHTSPTEILVDVGLKSEGIISGKELERIDRETLDGLKVGEKILAYVLNPEDKNGNVVLSLTRALEEQDWRKAEELHGTGEIYNGKVDGYNKGGLIVRFGRVRGFVPESQVSRERRRRAEGNDPQEKWGGMRGEDISVKVLEVDRSRNRLILSEREAAPQLREQQKERLLDELQVGDVKTGRVKSLADFGAFVDVGGADGLVHLTELSWKHITHPREVLKVGQPVEVEVISIDRERKRIGLSIKRREEDPWMAIARQYQIGQLVQGTITKLTKFGAFARLVDNPEIEGLIHISELADHRVNHPRDVVNEGESLALRVVKIEPEQRRMGLSLKRVSSPEYLDADYRRATTTPAEEEPSAEAAPPVVGDYVDYEAATLKNEDRRRADRKKGKKGKKGKDDLDDLDEFEEEDDTF